MRFCADAMRVEGILWSWKANKYSIGCIIGQTTQPNVWEPTWPLPAERPRTRGGGQEDLRSRARSSGGMCSEKVLRLAAPCPPLSLFVVELGGKQCCALSFECLETKNGQLQRAATRLSGQSHISLLA